MLPQLAAAADAQVGVFSHRQAIDAGYTPEEIRWRLKKQKWRKLRRGIFTAEPCRSDPRQVHLEQCAAAALARPHLVVSHESAALLHGLAVIGPFGTPTFLGGDGFGTRSGGIHVREAVLGQGDVGRIRHMRVTSQARTVVDVATVMSFRDAVAVADSALHLKRASRDELTDALERLASEGHRRRARRVAEFADGRSESAGESITRVLMADGRLPKPALNVWIGNDRVDFLFEDAGVIVEFDGRLKYTDVDVLWAEKLRQERLAAQGYVVIRVTWADVMDRPQETLQRIRIAIENARRARG